MRYKAYGHKKSNPVEEASYFNGTYGCWGALHKVAGQGAKSDTVITNIDYNIPNGDSSRAHALGYRSRKMRSTDVEVQTKAFEVATNIVKAIVGDNITFAFEVDTGLNQVWIKFSNFQHLPRNHVMWYMFAMRNLFECGSGNVVKEMKKRGVKSLRKLAMASLMFSFFKDSIRDNASWISASGMGGLNFIGSHTCVADIRSFYRNAKLRGPADTSFAEGNGYDCKGHGHGIQFSNCSMVKQINSKNLEQGFIRWDREIINNNSLFQNNTLKGSRDCETALDAYATFLKSLK
ncbi:MAG: hypothetical protein ACRC0G_03515 [Fusobacteriaceae bacterium]